MSERASAGGLRIVLVGATGALGQEVRAALDASSLRIASLVIVASDESIGTEFEFRGDLIYVVSEMPALQGVDLVVLCTPAETSLELIRAALRAEVPCIDCSGALSASPDVPLVMRDRGGVAEWMAPVVTIPSGVAIGWARVLGALDAVAGVDRVVGTVLHSAAHGGRRGIEALSSETIALLGQGEVPEPEIFPVPVAFDCVPAVRSDASSGDGESPAGALGLEAALATQLSRLLGDGARVAVTSVQVPTFVGEGTSLLVETRAPLSVEDAMAALEKAEGVELWAAREGAPSTRDTSGRDDALVGRVRRDPSGGDGNGILLWVATDGLRLVADEVAALAERRLSVN